MPRKSLILSETHPYHVCARTNNKEPFPLPLKRVWQIMNYELEKLSREKDLLVHSFVLMRNHFHLLALTPLGNLNQIMHLFMLRTSKKILSESGKINHLYGGPYSWTLINNKNYYFHAYRYIYQNPVRAGICKRVEDYPFSTIKRDNIRFPLISHVPLLWGGEEGEKKWLNETYSEEETYVLKCAFKRREFDFKPHPNLRKVPNKLVRRTFL